MTGLIYGFGLMLSGLCRISLVLSFLTLNKNWDPAAGIVFLVVALINFGTFRFLRNHGPKFS